MNYYEINWKRIQKNYQKMLREYGSLQGTSLNKFQFYRLKMFMEGKSICKFMSDTFWIWIISLGSERLKQEHILFIFSYYNHILDSKTCIMVEFWQRTLCFYHFTCELLLYVSTLLRKVNNQINWKCIEQF